MAAPTAQGSSAIVGNTGTITITPVLPAHAIDDILLVMAWIRSTSATLTTPAGWTLKATWDEGTIARYYVFWKRATSAAETNPAVAVGSGSADHYAHASVVRGCVKDGDPFDAFATTTGTADPGVATGITPDSHDCLLISLGGGRDNVATSVVITGTSPASWGTFSSTNSRFVVSAAGTDGACWFGFATQSTATATGTVSHDFSAALPGWGILIGALAPPPELRAGFVTMQDAGRDWDAPHQDINVGFTRPMSITPAPAVGDTVAGLTAQVNGGANAALTYRSGNGTTSWVVRRAELIQQDDNAVLDYSRASGNIVPVTGGGVELVETVDATVTNGLSKVVRVILRKSDNALVASETVKYALAIHAGGVASDANWMLKEQGNTATTTAAGLLEIVYTGINALVGELLYLTVIRPDLSPAESLVWEVTVE